MALLIYLVLPGFIFGLLSNVGFIKPRPADSWSNDLVRWVFIVPVYLGDTVRPIGQFYQWQCFVVSGHH